MQSGSGRAGQGPLYRVALQKLTVAQTTKQELLARIDDQTKLANQWLEKNSRTISQKMAEDEAERERHAAVLAALQHDVEKAQDEYLEAEKNREITIAKMKLDSNMVKAKAGLSAEISALDRLSQQPGHFAWFTSLKSLLILLELNAVASVLLWPSRQHAAVEEYAKHVLANEEIVYDVQRARSQRPPLNAFGAV
jgi:hypothetical protein